MTAPWSSRTRAPCRVTSTSSLLTSRLTRSPSRQQLQLVIKDGGTNIYSGPLASLGQQDLGTWAVGASHTYSFTVSFPDQGRDANGVGLDNAFMGASTTAAFTWTAVSVPQGAI